MATVVMLRHKESGLVRKGFIGFSWTTLFFGFFPALFRSDFITFIGGFVVVVILAVLTLGIGSGIAMFIWAFFYNKYYTRKLLEQGYTFASNGPETLEARVALGIAS